jgi:DNA polymerase bacteriophage-type
VPQRSETGATFALDELGWLDFEAANKQDDIRAGTYRYACSADAVIAVAAIGAGPVLTTAVKDFPQCLDWKHMPDPVKRHADRVLKGEAWWCAWNAGFDRATWNYATTGFPFMEAHHIIDAMAQAVASGLAPDLATAAKQTGSTHKVESGKHLIKLFCLTDSTATPITHPAEWAEFRDVYAPGDIVAMRDIFNRTRQLPLREWEEYWASEKINERGIAVDLRMVEHAATLAEEDKRRSKKELSRLTGNVVTTVDQVAKMTGWLMDRLPPNGRDILVKREEEVDEETGVITKPAKLSLTRKRVERLIALLQAAPETPSSLTTLRLLQIRLYGGSKTPAKFSRIMTQNLDGILRGQYVFNGAPQTGRFSSKGTQVHNLARDALKHEPDLINALLHQCSYEMFATLGSNDPVARKLALLIRPALVPDSDKVFVWSDLAQIEARIPPWLTGGDPEAEERLDIFREVDADPRQDPKHPDHANRIPDLYTRTASTLSGIPIHMVTKPIRQRGKVAELALGFMGGVGALLNMAAGYGLHLDDAEAKEIVIRWREANAWAVRFSKDLWEAAREAHHNPGGFIPVGRIGFIFLPNYLGGSLLMRLPSGRLITYRRLKWEYIPVLDDDDQPTGEVKLELTCHRGYGRIKLWPGLFVENATQATAADFLRGAIVRIENSGNDWMPARLHTHDELLAECEVKHADWAKETLRQIMQQGYDWSDGLPIMSDETVAYYYSKHEDSYGL